MNPKEAVIIGGSAGSLEALRVILRHLPQDYGLAVMIAVHQHRHGGRRLAVVLAIDSRMPVRSIEDGEPIVRGRIHVCPPNYHVLVDAHRCFALATDPPVNHSRPSIDVLFESASGVYGDRLVGVLLSGASADGALGLVAIEACGGAVVCQDPATAREPTMPLAGCCATKSCSVGSADWIGLQLAELHS